MIADVPTFVKALQADFDAEIAGPNGIAVEWPNAPFTAPAISDPWIRFRVIFGDRRQTEFGTPKRFRQPGVLALNLFFPLLDGEANAFALAAEIEDRYRATSLVGATFLTPTIQAGSRDGARWNLPVQCPFYADLTA